MIIQPAGTASHSQHIVQQNLWLLFLANATMGMGQTIIFAVMPMLGRELQLDKLVISLPWMNTSYAPRELAITFFSTLSALLFFLVAPVWGRYSDKIGRKKVVILGLAGYVVGTLFFNLVGHAGLSGAASGFLLYAMLAIARVSGVITLSAIGPASTAYIVDTSGPMSRTREMGRMGAVNQVGAMLGPAFAYFATFSFLAPFYIHAGLMMVIAIAMLLYFREAPIERVSASSKVAKLSYFDPRFRNLMAVGMLMFILMAMVQQTLGFYFQDRLALDSVTATQYYSMAMVVSSMAMLFSQIVIVQRWQRNPIYLLKLGLPIIMVGFMGIALVHSHYGLTLCMVLFGFGMGLAVPGFAVSATFLVDSHEQGALAGLTAAAGALGYVFGPTLGGLIYSVNPEYTYWGATLVMLALSLLVQHIGLNHNVS